MIRVTDGCCRIILIDITYLKGVHLSGGVAESECMLIDQI